MTEFARRGQWARAKGESQLAEFGQTGFLLGTHPSGIGVHPGGELESPAGVSNDVVEYRAQGLAGAAALRQRDEFTDQREDMAKLETDFA
jgi:hypothetical protein